MSFSTENSWIDDRGWWPRCGKYLENLERSVLLRLAFLHCSDSFFLVRFIFYTHPFITLYEPEARPPDPNIPRFQHTNWAKLVTRSRKHELIIFFPWWFTLSIQAAHQWISDHSRAGGMRMAPERSWDDFCWWPLILKKHFNLRLILLKRDHEIQNYWHVVKSNATKMSVVTLTILYFGQIVLNLYFLFFIGSITKIRGVAISRWMFHRKSWNCLRVLVSVKPNSDFFG
jgi:hypothetical protein